MNILHLNILSEIVLPALRRASRNHAEKRETLAPHYFLGVALLLGLAVLPMVLRILAFVTFP